MIKEICSSFSCIVLIILLAEIVLGIPQGYNYYANQQRNYYAQRAAQIQRIQSLRIAEQNRYYQKSLRTTRKPENKINKADLENAKFLGLQNQEPDEPGRTFKKKAKKLLGVGYGAGYGCKTKKSDEQKDEGRVFWDLNVYNVYPNRGCGVGNLGDTGDDGLSDPYPADYDEVNPGTYGGDWIVPYYDNRPFGGFFQNWLGLFRPGGAVSGVNRPLSNQQADSTNSGSNTLDNAGPNFQFLSDSEVMAGITPGHLVSGVASTINNVIQQLSYG